MQRLEEASLAGGSNEHTTVDSFGSLPDPVEDVVVAARVTDVSGFVERSVIGGVTPASESDCVRTRLDAAESVFVREDGGTVTLAATPASALDFHTVQYRTFIPAASADSVVCGVFKGDNRGFSNDLVASFRTNVLVTTSWTAGTLTTTGQVGKTVRTGGVGGAGEATASAAGIKFVFKSANSTHVGPM